MEYRVLGPLEVHDGQGSLPLAGAKQRALLALLLLQANHVLSRDRLIDGLWGDEPPETAVQSLQVYVSRLRKLLPAETLLTRPPGYLLQVDPAELDLHCFERLLGEGREALAEGDAERAATALHDALSLWRGPALAEFAFEPFAQAEIGRLEDLRLAAVEERIEADLALGRHADLVGELEALVAEHPYRERVRGQLMLALYRSDRQTEALAAYQDARRTLVDELGIEPGAALQRLEMAILRQDEELERPARRPTSTLSRSNLPTPATPYVEREREQAEVRELLAREDVHLLTLTGPGGTGKTRLALQAAAKVADAYEHGVWWVPLAALRDPALVMEQAAQVLGAVKDLSRHIDDRHLLLLFDNFEPVVQAGLHVSELIAACPKLDVFVTSREALHVAGEQVYPVPPLLEPEALELFEARARAAVPDFSANGAVSEICRRLDYLPLAIELAAARLVALSPEQILERLEQRLPLLTRSPHNVPKRQRTLRATIEWSHELLQEEEQRLFRCLAVFSGGSRLEASEAVIYADLETLQSLVEKSLVRHTGERFWMLETIREYALDRLEESGEDDEIRQRHAEFFCRLGERADAELEGPEQDIWLNVIAEEHDNVRSALEWTLAGRDPELGVRLASSLHQFWKTRGYGIEGRHWTDQALAADAELEPRIEMRLLKAVVVMRGEVGDWAATRDPTMRRMQLARELGDEREVAQCLNNLANFAWKVTRDTEEAVSLFKESIALLRRLGDRIDVPLRNLARIAEDEHDYERAEALATESLVIAREVGDLKMVRDVSQIIGWIRLEQGRMREAIQIEWDVFRLAYKLRHPIALVVCAQFMAVVLARVGAARRSAELFGKGHVLLEEQEVPWDPARFPRAAAAMATVRNELSEEAWLEAVTVGHGADVRELLEVSLREAEAAVAAAEGVQS